MAKKINSKKQKKSEPYYKRIEVVKLHCPICNQCMTGDGSIVLPYQCKCGVWKAKLENVEITWSLIVKNYENI